MGGAWAGGRSVCAWGKEVGLGWVGLGWSGRR